MNIKHNFNMSNNYFNDETNYKKVYSNCDTKVIKGIAKALEKYKGN